MSLSKIMVLDITCNLTISLNNKKATLTASCVLLLEMKCCILEYRSTTKRTILKSCRDKIHTQVLSRLLKDWQRRVQSGQVFYFLVLANRQTRHFWIKIPFVAANPANRISLRVWQWSCHVRNDQQILQHVYSHITYSWKEVECGHKRVPQKMYPNCMI